MVYRVYDENLDITKDYTTIENGGTITGLNHKDTVEACFKDATSKDENDYGAPVTLYILDKEAPKVQLNVMSKEMYSIKVSVQVTDQGTGYDSSKGIEYYLDGEKKETTTSSTYTFTGLAPGKGYSIKVKAWDKAENEGEYTSTIFTSSIPTAKGVISFEDVTWKDYKASTVIKQNQDAEFTLVYRVYDENMKVVKNYTTAMDGDTISNLGHKYLVEACFTDGKYYGSAATLDVRDTTPPEVSVSSNASRTEMYKLGVLVHAEDNEAGMGDNTTYKYYIKEKNTKSFPKEPTATTNSSSYVFSDLKAGQEYSIKVEADDKAGNWGTSEEITASTVKIDTAVGKLSFGNLTWSEGKASVNVYRDVENNFSMAYSVVNKKNAYKVRNKAISNGEKITGLDHNDTVEVNFTDGVSYGDAATLTIVDNIAPTVTIKLDSSSITTNSVDVTVTASDEEWGMPTIPQYKCYLNGEINVTANKNTFTVDKLVYGKENVIKVEVEDKAGNVGSAECTVTPNKVETAVGKIIFGDTKWSGGLASVTVSKSVENDYTMQYKKYDENNKEIDSKWRVVEDGGSVGGLKTGYTIEVCFYDGTNRGESATLTITDTEPPKVTVSQVGSNTGTGSGGSTSDGSTGSGTGGSSGGSTSGSATSDYDTITVKVTASDSQSGIKELRYYIKESSSSDYGSPKKTTTASVTTYTFTGLSEGTSYDVKVEAVDYGGNIGNATIPRIKTKKVDTAVGAVSFGGKKWSNGTLSITVNKNTTNSYTMKYMVISSSNTVAKLASTLQPVSVWTEINNGDTVTGLKINDVLCVAFADGNRLGEQATLQVADNIAPTVTVTANSTDYNSISVSVSATDNESGMPSSPTYQYYLNNVLTATTSSSSYTFSDLIEGKTYNIKVTTKDNQGNAGTGAISATTKPIDSAKGSITFTDMKWENGSMSIKVNKTATNKFTMLYQVLDSTNTIKVRDTEISSGGTITGLKAGDLVYVYFASGSRKGADPATLQISDTVKPTVSATISALYTKITLKVTASDNESGIKEYAYYLRKSGTNAEYKLYNQSKNTSYTFENLTQGGIYDVKVIVYDNAGNYAESGGGSVSTNKCNTCNGTRITRTKCTYCTDGYLYNTCSSCNGTGYSDNSSCSSCGGTGTITCMNCGGTGGTVGTSEMCNSCNGTGVIEEMCYQCNGMGMLDMPCGSCGGSGSIGTDETGMSLPCGSCGGSGMMQETCPSCDGMGMTRQQCSSCYGLGTIEVPGETCPTCNGNGNIQCPDCNGTGSRGDTCSTCNGAGKVKTGKCTHCTDGYIESECSTCKGK